MAGMNSSADLYTQVLSYRSNAAPIQCLAQPWFVRVQHRIAYPRYGCHLQPLICGEEVFGRIAQDLESAQLSVDIITWGFDPGMVLVRGSTAEAGTRLGDLLQKIASRGKDGVKVRILVWHDDIVAHELMKNNPGYYGQWLPGIDGVFTQYFSEKHQTYNAEWYSKVYADKIPNVHLHVRDIPTSLVEQSLSGEAVPTGVLASATKRYAAHHQKMVLIDYENPKLAKGYVMGHNFITDFWDTKEHKFRDKRRERFYTKDFLDLEKEAWEQGQNFDAFNFSMSERQQQEKLRLVQSYLDAHSYVTKPYQDVSCRVRGPILYDLNHNFCQAWSESKRPSALGGELISLVPGRVLRAAKEMMNGIGELMHKEMDPEFRKRRESIRLSEFALSFGHHNAQLLRTQPLHGEKSIKECYANLTRQMRNYIFIQNQYIQYQSWADHLLECVRRLRAAGYLKPIYVFILTSTPEKEGMDRPTYDVAGKIGKSESMPYEHMEAVEKARQQKVAAPLTPEELSVHGIYVFMGSLWTCSDKNGKLSQADYEEIYIHSKVAIVDDAAFTIGSANLNLRSMALDSELNVLSEAKDVAYQLRADLFWQCSGKTGPAQFGDMKDDFDDWIFAAAENASHMKRGKPLKSQLLPFYVDRKPGQPVI